jgi:uncharacterized protein YehS (DUF1456 family)
MKTYQIPVVRNVRRFVEVEANSLAEAMEKVELAIETKDFSKYASFENEENVPETETVDYINIQETFPNDVPWK